MNSFNDKQLAIEDIIKNMILLDFPTDIVKRTLFSIIKNEDYDYNYMFEKIIEESYNTIDNLKNIIEIIEKFLKYIVITEITIDFNTIIENINFDKIIYNENNINYLFSILLQNNFVNLNNSTPMGKHIILFYIYYKKIIEEFKPDWNYNNIFYDLCGITNVTIPILKFIYTLGISKDYKTPDGYTFATMAMKNNRLDILKYIVEEVGTDITLHDNKGLSIVNYSRDKCKLYIYKHIPITLLNKYFSIKYIEKQTNKNMKPMIYEHKIKENDSK